MEGDGPVRGPVRVRSLGRFEPVLEQRRGCCCDRVVVVEVEDELVERSGLIGVAVGAHDLHLGGGVRQPEDGAIFAEAIGELTDDRKTDGPAVERDRVVVVTARACPPQRARPRVRRPPAEVFSPSAAHVGPPRPTTARAAIESSVFGARRCARKGGGLLSAVGR